MSDNSFSTQLLEDELSDLDNDLIQLRLVLNRLKDEAVAEFGKGVLSFNKDAL